MKKLINNIFERPIDIESLSKRVSKGTGNIHEAEFIIDVILNTLSKNKPLPIFLNQYILVALRKFKKYKDLNKAFELIKDGRPKGDSPDYFSGRPYVLDIAKEMMSGTNKTSAIEYVASKNKTYKVSTLTKDFNIYKSQAFKTCVAEIYLAGNMLSEKQIYTLKKHSNLRIKI